ncbi:MAG TPA: TetR/AcrR family transcriptional regulator [Polyangia bacterium]|jgi:AcrR family transcriptional regulator|nr:TetR/AcrR family transcriptional regulator [Polyangia bacterium]
MTASLGRRHLLDAAAQEFAELGYAGATTAGIARRAQVTQPLVHHHFKSKEGLWLAVVAELFTELQEELASTATTQTEAPRDARLRELLRALVHFSGTRPLLSRLIRTEGRRDSDAFDLIYQRWLSPLVQFFRDEIEAATRDGTVREFDPGLLYFLIVGASVEGFAQPETARRAFGLDLSTPDSIERYAEAVIEVLMRGILKQPQS